MRYLRWTRDDGETGPEISEVWTEVNNDGVVTREMGFDERMEIVHRMPSGRFPQGTYGLFDLATIDLGLRHRDVPADEFERRWTASLIERPEG